VGILKRNNLVGAKLFFTICFMLSLIGFFLFISFARETYLYQIFVQTGFLSMALFFVWKGNIAATLKGIGIPGNLKINIIWFILGGILIFVAALLNAVVLYLLDLNDAYKVYDIIATVPPWVLVVAVFVAPVTEELLFRAALVPRLGIVFSSLLFGLFHISYGSISEILGTILIGLILAYVFKKSNSIVSPILLHLGFNLVSVMAVLIAGGWLP